MLVTALLFSIVCAVLLSLMVLGVYLVIEKVFERMDEQVHPHH
ncbi:hypothetical protein [Deinococcus cellulosilyticus]|uniref:Uncharacterized protein n=1 Tax=Deinococcus cellulosilyticus (strain DSM 18568 / NBRC 106333 / KACC 11606 / 5516J-15) TaxID=1223518 RepID=A0A511NA92_DEIC1|nr:hypothetical protein [Deinococcus cellulosilyticus]GEM49487.1 hypothetical protein DC3_51220 [Deinococcus cellulosilyticus NBRC 106333 = KACC 11606]